MGPSVAASIAAARNAPGRADLHRRPALLRGADDDVEQPVAPPRQIKQARESRHVGHLPGCLREPAIPRARDQREQGLVYVTAALPGQLAASRQRAEDVDRVVHDERVPAHVPADEARRGVERDGEARRVLCLVPYGAGRGARLAPHFGTEPLGDLRREGLPVVHADGPLTEHPREGEGLAAAFRGVSSAARTVGASTSRTATLRPPPAFTSGVNVQRTLFRAFPPQPGEAAGCGGRSPAAPSHRPR